MIIGEIFTAPVERLAAGGAGLLRLQGRPVFIDAAVPGDIIAGRIREDHKDWASAELLEIVEPSPNRVEPDCPRDEACGGCSLQRLSYQAQVAEKSRILADALLRIGGFGKDSALPEIAVYPSQPYEYRNRVQFHRSGSAVGFKARKSAAVIPLADCPVADPGIRRALREKRLRPPPEKDRFTVYAWKKTFLSEGANPRGTVSLLGREILMDAGVFFQSNGTMLEQTIPDILAFAETAEPPAADLYCGVGTFAVFLRDYFSSIDLLEENKTALALARENVRGHEVRYAALSDEQWAKKTDKAYGFILADPPRQGLSPAMRSMLARSGPPRLAYLSCDSATFARDARELTRGGYRLEKLHWYDFYPHTPKLEVLGFFEKPKNP
ncbi:MAG: methyltransferase [Spirochaetaceae bacterium]|nr:methyltransferase [Spirochaetaceae bacterium]